MAPPGSVLLLRFAPEISAEVDDAAAAFNSGFLYRCGPEATVEGHTVRVSAYDAADFFRYLKRTPENEFFLFQLKRQAIRQVEGMGNDATIAECLRHIHWNQPHI